MMWTIFVKAAESCTSTELYRAMRRTPIFLPNVLGHRAHGPHVPNPSFRLAHPSKLTKIPVHPDAREIPVRQEGPPEGRS
jgi:hypothetical protein